MKKLTTLLFLSSAIIFLFTNAGKITHRKIALREWYLETNLDSAQFFSADTLRFTNPYTNIFKSFSPNQFPKGDSSWAHPVFRFGIYTKNEFDLLFPFFGDTTLADGTKYDSWDIACHGIFKTDKKTRILTLNFYDFTEPASGKTEDGNKILTQKYFITEISKNKLVLVKIKNE